jgi:hypothetical protein
MKNGDDLDEVRGNFLVEMGKLWPFVRGSLSQVRKRCNQPNCAACARGDKHPAWHFHYTENGRRRCTSVPVELVEWLHKAIDNGRKLETLLQQLGPQLLRCYEKTGVFTSKGKRQTFID